jgi:SAM-dependent methyltransferase
MSSWRQASPSEPGLAARRSYRLDRCRACGTAALAPRERSEESDLLYRKGHYAPASSLAEPVLEKLRQVLDRDRLRLLAPLAPGSRIFEIGAGDGRLVTALLNRGYDASGIDPTRARGSPRRERATVAPVRFEDYESSAQQDAVVAMHVLEHLDDPEAAVAKAARMLKPGGVLVVAVPNLTSLQASLGGDAWFHQDIPRHATLFTRAGLVALLERSGLRVENVTTRVLDQTLLGMWQTLLNRLTRERNVLFRLLKGQLPTGRGLRPGLDVAVTVVAALPLALAAVALEGLAVLAQRGGAVVARAVVQSAPPTEASP